MESVALLDRAGRRRSPAPHRAFTRVARHATKASGIRRTRQQLKRSSR
jgi:hypothetical protein